MFYIFLLTLNFYHYLSYMKNQKFTRKNQLFVVFIFARLKQTSTSCCVLLKKTLYIEIISATTEILINNKKLLNFKKDFLYQKTFINSMSHITINNIHISQVKLTDLHIHLIKLILNFNSLPQNYYYKNIWIFFNVTSG